MDIDSFCNIIAHLIYYVTNYPKASSVCGYKHLLSHSFCESGLWAQLGVSPEAPSEASTRPAVILMLNQGRIHFDTHSYDWAATCLHQMSSGALRPLLWGPRHRELTTWRLASSRAKAPNQTGDREQSRITDFSNLLSEGTIRRFCYSLVVRSESIGPVHTQEEGIT